jgi:hypothetical protein
MMSLVVLPWTVPRNRDSIAEFKKSVKRDLSILSVSPKTGISGTRLGSILLLLVDGRAYDLDVGLDSIHYYSLVMMLVDPSTRRIGGRVVK